MSIESVEVTNAQGNLLTFTLDDISNGYVVQDIGGLDPVKASIVSSSFANMDGQQYQASSRDIRNITMEIGFDPNVDTNQTVRSLRTHLYQFFMTDIPVTLTFNMSDGLTVKTSGRVESCEAPLFTQDPQANISIVCFDPDFVDPTLVELHSTFTTTDTVSHTIQVDGTVKTGLTSLRFTAPKTLSEFAIYHTTPAGNLRIMLVSAPLIVDDVVEMCTVKGQKNITLSRAGVTSSLLWAVAPESDWVLLEHGENQFYLHASDTTPVPVYVDFYNRYGGL